MHKYAMNHKSVLIINALQLHTIYGNIYAQMILFFK